MSCCNCGQPERLCRCPKGKGEAPKRAYIAECTDCDPCRPCKSMVKICSFVAPTLTEGQRFRNSFIYNQEDDSVYYIDDAGTPTRFGSSPMFIDNFNPDDRSIPRQIVFDFVNNRAYVYSPEGEYVTVDLGGGGATTIKKLHVYFPEIENAVSYSGGRTGRLALNYAPGGETITIKDDDGNTISPEDFIALGDELINYNIVAHVEAMSEVNYGSGTVIVPEQSFVLSPSIAGDGGDGTFVLSGSEYNGETWGIAAGSEGGVSLYIANIIVNAYMGV